MQLQAAQGTLAKYPVIYEETKRAPWTVADSQGTRLWRAQHGAPQMPRRSAPFGGAFVVAVVEDGVLAARLLYLRIERDDEMRHAELAYVSHLQNSRQALSLTPSNSLIMQVVGGTYQPPEAASDGRPRRDDMMC